MVILMIQVAAAAIACEPVPFKESTFEKILVPAGRGDRISLPHTVEPETGALCPVFGDRKQARVCD